MQYFIAFLLAIALVGLDTRLGCLQKNLPPDSDAVKLINSVQTMFDGVHKLEAFSGNIQFWKLFPTPTWKEFEKAGDVFTELVCVIILYIYIYIY